MPLLLLLLSIVVIGSDIDPVDWEDCLEMKENRVGMYVCTGLGQGLELGQQLCN